MSYVRWNVIDAVDISIMVALAWLAFALFVRLVGASKAPRHVWGELNSAQIVRMRRRPDRR